MGWQVPPHLPKRSYMKEISIDIETYSDVDLGKCGVYKYAESENAELLLFGYSVDNGPVEIIDVISGEKLPQEILEALVDESIIKTAFNAMFERVFLSYWLKRNYPSIFKPYGDENDTVGNYLNPKSWRCTMVWASYLTLPPKLKDVGMVLGLDKQKLDEGKDLIRYFCLPCKPTKANDQRTRNLPFHSKEKWELFKAYNKRDVEVEIAIKERLSKFPVPDFIWEEYHIDQKINDRGILVDLELVEHAIELDNMVKQELIDTMQKITDLENPNSVKQLREWLGDNGLNLDSLGKKEIQAILPNTTGDVEKVLKLRQQLAKSSIKKYQAMKNCVCKDNRARGLYQFYGANRTGRWSGRLIQFQNLARNEMIDLDEARTLVKLGDYESIYMLYDNIPDMLSQLIRTAFIARDGYMFYVADFSAIEARVIAYMAKESWRLQLFADGGDIYCKSASQMFGVPVEKHGVNGHLRQKGKIAELACGYGGSVGALTAMGALEMGLKEEELKPLVDSWRDANPNIVDMWWSFDEAIKETIKTRLPSSTHGVNFYWKSGMLFMELPSGRKLVYIKPRLGENQFGGESITYEGIGDNKKWQRLESYGPKFVENCVQVVSRDLLINGIRNLQDKYICGHVHDELIIECPIGTELNEICEKMAERPDWMKDINIRSDGYCTKYYLKD